MEVMNLAKRQRLKAKTAEIKRTSFSLREASRFQFVYGIRLNKTSCLQCDLEKVSVLTLTKAGRSQNSHEG